MLICISTIGFNQSPTVGNIMSATDNQTNTAGNYKFDYNSVE